VRCQRKNFILNKQKMKIGIIGLGFVGNAIYQTLLKRNIEMIVYDKYKYGGIGSLAATLEASMIFLCLPTPFDSVTSSYDNISLHEVCQGLSDADYNGIVIIKSTVSPGTSQQLAETYRLKVVHNPEFLSARTAVEDFENQRHIVLGSTSLSVNELLDGGAFDRGTSEVKSFYLEHFPSAEISVTTSGHSESMKIFCNSFYATKVQVFNEFYLFCQKMGYDYDNVRDLMLKNGWIYPLHTQVPGTDGRLSFGGACLPKDIQALCSQMTAESVPCAVLKACIEERNAMRPD